MTFGEWHRYIINQLSKIYSAGEAKSIARVVFEDVLKLNSVDFFLKAKAEADPVIQSRLEEIVKRLLQHEPVQYVTGTAHFYGLKFKVDLRVLIPRPETEELVKWILSDIKDNAHLAKPAILDIGTGSGCIAIALKKNSVEGDIFALDISEEALTVARENAVLNNVEVIFFVGDILNRKSAKDSIRYDIIVSNPPYIRKSEQSNMSANVLNYEPHTALFVDSNDALLFYKVISKFAANALNTNGRLYFEINESLGAEVKQLLEQSAFRDCIIQKDINGKERIVRCTAPFTQVGN